MKLGSVRPSIACGLSAVIVSVSLLGCAGTPVINRPMYTADLDAFQIDCDRRPEQVRMLLSMLSSKDDQLLAYWTNYWQPWKDFIGDDDQRLRRDIYSRMTNWTINQHLMNLAWHCP